MRFIIFILLFSQLAIAQQPVVSLSEVVVNQNDNEKSYRNFQKHIKNNRLYNEAKLSNFTYWSDNSEKGILYLSKLKIDSISTENSKVKNILQSTLEVAYTHWVIIDNKTIKNFICSDLGNRNWNFTSHKEDEKIKLKHTDTIDFNVKLSEKGKIEEINSTFFSSDNDKYTMKIIFQEFKKGIRLVSIQASVTKKSENMKIDIIF